MKIFFWTIFITVVAMLLFGCKTVPTAVPTPDLAGIPACDGSAPDDASICSNYSFTETNYACFDCGVLKGCVDKATQIYCANSCDPKVDTRCSKFDEMQAHRQKSTAVKK